MGGGGASGVSTDDLLSQLASDEIDRLMAEESGGDLGVDSVGAGGRGGAGETGAAIGAGQGGEIASLAADAIAREVEQEVVEAVLAAAAGESPVAAVGVPDEPPLKEVRAEEVRAVKSPPVSTPMARQEPVAAPAVGEKADAPATQADIDAMFAGTSEVSAPVTVDRAPEPKPAEEVTPSPEAVPAPDAQLAVAKELDALFHAPVAEHADAVAEVADGEPGAAEPLTGELDALFAELTKGDETATAGAVSASPVESSRTELQVVPESPAPVAPTEPQIPAPASPAAIEATAAPKDAVEGDLDALFAELTKGEETAAVAPVKAAVAPVSTAKDTGTTPAKAVATSVPQAPAKAVEPVDEALEAELNELYSALTSVDATVLAAVAAAPMPAAKPTTTAKAIPAPTAPTAEPTDPALQESLDELFSELVGSEEAVSPPTAQAKVAQNAASAAAPSADAVMEGTLDELFNELTGAETPVAKTPVKKGDGRAAGTPAKAREQAREERAPVRPEPVATNEAGFSVIRDGAWRKKEGADDALQERAPSAEELERLAKYDIAPVRPVEEDQVKRGPEVAPRRDIDTTDARVVDDNAPDRPEEELPAEELPPVASDAKEPDAKTEDFGLPGFDNVTFDDPSAVPATSADAPLVMAPGQAAGSATPSPAAVSSGPPFVSASENWSLAEGELNVLDSLSDPGTSRSKWAMKLLVLMNSPFESVDSKLRDLLGKIAVVTIFHGTAVLLYVYLIRGG